MCSYYTCSILILSQEDFSFLHFIPLSTNKRILPTFPFFHLTNVKRKSYLYVYSDPTSIRNFKVMTKYSNFRPATQDKTVLEIEKVFQVKGYLVDEIWCLTNKDWASFIQRLSSSHVFTNFFHDFLCDIRLRFRLR